MNKIVILDPVLGINNYDRSVLISTYPYYFESYRDYLQALISHISVL